MKRLLLTALLCAFALFLLILGLQSPAFDAFLGGRVAAFASAAGARVRFRSFEFDLRGPQVRCSGLLVQAADGAWTASAERASIRLNLLRSLSGTPHLVVEAEAPVFRGTVPFVSKKKEKFELPNLVLDTVRLSRGAFSVKAAEFDFSAQVPSVEVAWIEGAGQGSLKGGGITWEGEEEPLRELSFSGSRKLGILRLDRVALESRRVAVTASGRKGLKDLLEGSILARVSVEGLPQAWIDAVELEEYAPVEGAVALRGSVTGTLTAPRFRGGASLSSGRFGPIAFQGAGLLLDADPDGLSFRELWARSDTGSAARVRGSLSWKEGVRLDARGEIADYRLRPFMALFLKDYFPVGLIASGRFEATGPLYPKLALACRVEASGRDLDVTTVDEEGRRTWFSLPTGQLLARCVVREDDLVFGPTEIRSPWASVRMPKGRIHYDTGLDLETDLEVRSLALVQQYVPDGLDARGRLRGRFAGPYEALKFRYAVDLASTKVAQEEMGRLTGNAEFDLRDLVVKNGLLEGPLGRFRASGVATLRTAGPLDVAVQWTAGDLPRLARVARRFTPEVPEATRGSAFAEGRVLGNLEAPVFQGKVRAEGVRVGTVDVDRAAAEGSFGTRSWAIRQASAAAWGGTLEATGSGNESTFRASGRVRGLSLPALERVAGRELPVTGAFEGEFEAQGPYGKPTTRLEGRLSHFGVREQSVGEVRVAAALTGRDLRANARAFGGAVDASARLTLGERFPFEAEASIRDLPWEKVSDKLRPEGVQARSLGGQGRALGFLSDFELTSARWEGSLEGVHSPKLDVGQLRVSADYAAAAGSSFSVSAWQTRARLEGSLPRGSDRLTLRLAAEALDLSRLAPLTGVAGGRLSMAARGGADLARLRNASGRDRLRAFSELSGEGRLNDLVLARDARLGQATFRVETRNGMPELEAVSGGARVSARLIDWDKLQWAARADLRDVNPGEYFRPGSRLAGLTGTVSGAASVEGEGDQLRGGRAEGSLRDVAFDPARASAWTWAAELRGEHVIFSAREPRGVDLAGSWSRAGGLAVRAILRDAPLQGWLVERLMPADFRGSARGEIQVLLPPAGQPSGEARFERVAFALPPVEAEAVGPVTLSLRKGEIRLGTVALKGQDFRLEASGSITPGSEWDLKLRGSTDLALVRRLTPMIREASGTASADVTIRGPWRAPAVEGPLEVPAGARLVLEGLDQPLSDVFARGYLDAKRGLALDRLEARLGDEGRVRAEGLLGMKDLRLKDLRVFMEARNISYERPKQVTYRFDADLVASGTPERPEVRGEVRLKNLTYARRLNWKTMVLDFLNRRPREVERRTTERGVFVDISVLGSHDLKVENNLADLELGVDLRARGYLPDPFLWGRVEVLNGTVRFRSQRYEALRSAVEFLGETQPMPLLDLHARSTVGQYAVSVSVNGPLDKYQVNLASVPALSQTELVSLLTVGSAPTERVSAATMLSGGPVKESATTQTITTVEATSFLTGRIQDVLESEVSDLLGFEQFHIDPAYSATTQTSVPKVTVGKTITQSLAARYSAAVGAQTEQDFELQYTVSPKVQLLGTWSDKSTQTKGSLGGEVRFRFTFR